MKAVRVSGYSGNYACGHCMITYLGVAETLEGAQMAYAEHMRLKHGVDVTQLAST